jgi:hypothetical protein
MESMMRPMNVFCYFFGFACGAAAVYFADPQRGRARRAMVRDKALSLANQAQDYVEKTARDLGHRAQGLVHESRKAVAGGEGQRLQAPAM